MEPSARQYFRRFPTSEAPTEPHWTGARARAATHSCLIHCRPVQPHVSVGWNRGKRVVWEPPTEGGPTTRATRGQLRVLIPHVPRMSPATACLVTGVGVRRHAAHIYRRSTACLGIAGFRSKFGAAGRRFAPMRGQFRVRCRCPFLLPVASNGQPQVEQLPTHTRTSGSKPCRFTIWNVPVSM
jgi:hypothetical protein